MVLNLVANGCPVEAIVAVFGFQARTVRGWIGKAGGHCERVHNELVVQPRELGQVQADGYHLGEQGQDAAGSNVDGNGAHGVYSPVAGRGVLSQPQPCLD